LEEYIQVITTTERREDAQKIADTLVEKRLAGCVQILGPITSTYRWKGNVETAEEWLVTIKTRKNLYSQVEEAIKATHPYETPEIIAVPITTGSREYLEWLNSELKK